MKLLVCVDGTKLSHEIVPVVRALLRDVTDPEVEVLRVISPAGVHATVRGDGRTTPLGDPLGVADASGGLVPGASSRVAPDVRPRFVEDSVHALDRAEHEARDAVQHIAQALHPAARGVVVDSDDPGLAIVTYAGEHHVTLIAMSTHSRGPLGQILAGSTAARVLQSGAAPVFLIHPTPENAARWSL